MSEEHSKQAGSLLFHLEEFARTIRNAALVLLVGCTLGLLGAKVILAELIKPYGGKLQVLGPTEGISILIRVGLAIGAAVASPIIIYQILNFIIPAIETAQEKRVARSLRFALIPAAYLLFLVGAAFAWFVMIPAAIGFLANFEIDLFNTEWTAERYVPFVLSLTLWVGISFEMPLVFWFLGSIGVIGPKPLLKGWRFAVVAIAIIAAAITPTVDPFNMMLVMGPLIGLYFLSIILNAWAYWGHHRRMRGPVAKRPRRWRRSVGKKK